MACWKRAIVFIDKVETWTLADVGKLASKLQEPKDLICGDVQAFQKQLTGVRVMAAA